MSQTKVKPAVTVALAAPFGMKGHEDKLTAPSVAPAVMKVLLMTGAGLATANYLMHALDNLPPQFGSSPPLPSLSDERFESAAGRHLPDFGSAHPAAAPDLEPETHLSPALPASTPTSPPPLARSRSMPELQIQTGQQYQLVPSTRFEPIPNARPAEAGLMLPPASSGTADDNPAPAVPSRLAPRPESPTSRTAAIGTIAPGAIPSSSQPGGTAAAGGPVALASPTPDAPRTAAMNTGSVAHGTEDLPARGSAAGLANAPITGKAADRATTGRSAASALIPATHEPSPDGTTASPQAAAAPPITIAISPAASLSDFAPTPATQPITPAQPAGGEPLKRLATPPSTLPAPDIDDGLQAMTTSPSALSAADGTARLQGLADLSPPPVAHAGIGHPRQTVKGVEFDVAARVNGSGSRRLALLVAHANEDYPEYAAESISVRLYDVLGLLRDRMDPGTFSRLSSSANAQTYVTFNELRASGLSVAFDKDDSLVIKTL